MSTDTPAADSTPAPQSAAEAAPAAEGAAPAAESAEFLDTQASEVKADDAKAEEKKSDAKPEGEGEKDFLAETDDDDAEKEADAPGDAEKKDESEAYQPFTLPDGQALDETVLAEATPLFRKLNLDQEGAQELVSFYAAKTKGALEAFHQSLAEGHQQNLKTWSADLKALPEYKGKALSEAKGRVANVLNQIGTPELKQLLDKDYGLIRHPAVFKFLDAVGSKLSEDSIVRDDAGAPVKGPPQRDADVFYS